MNLWQAWLQSPLVVRYVILGLVGLVVGGQINRGIYRLAWNARTITPWGPLPTGAGPRSWADRVPVLGWLRLQRESPLHGRGFWVRPLLVELGTALAFVGLYWWEVDELALIPRLPGVGLGTPRLLATVHMQFAAHITLFSLMMVASFIDFDEKTIPDAITVTGTLIALIMACLWPRMLPPTVEQVGGANLFQLKPLLIAPDWPAWLDELRGLVAISFLYAGWCVALLNSLTTLRRGLRKGVQYYLVSICRRGSWILVLPILVGGWILVASVWNIGGPRWQSLSSSIVGMAFGGCLIWGVRIVGRWALGIEAMGFGDVTLMALIGAFLGWQSTVLVFFLAPLAALVIAVIQLLATGTHYIAFGPYLCLGALTLIAGWDKLWTNWAELVFNPIGKVIPAMLLCCLALMGLLLRAWRAFRERVLGWHY